MTRTLIRGLYLGLSAAVLACGTARSQTVLVSATASTQETAESRPLPSVSPAQTQESDSGSLGSDAKAYFTAPLQWRATEWAWFGGSVAAIALAHRYDFQVRAHFLNPGSTASTNSNDLQDAIPTLAVFGATWLYANLIDDSAGRRETWAMFEAAGFSAISAYAIKYTTRRERPDQTSDPNEWWKSGGDGFPSQHSTVAFAVGTVLAESGNDEYRWIRRLLGYGLGVVTSYERLKHNTHWLSDVVAGSALGIASAHFAMHREERSDEESAVRLEPAPGGVMLTYRITLP